MDYRKKSARDVTPYLIVKNVAGLIDYLQKSMEAEIDGILHRPNDTLMHAEIKIGDSLIMLGEPMGSFEAMPSNLFIYVADPAAVIERAIEHGGQLLMELTEMPHAGVKYGGIKDPSGNNWWIGRHEKDMTWEEQQQQINANASVWSD